MLPISAIVGVSTVGYLLDQLFSEKKFEEDNKNNTIPLDYINGSAEKYPWNYVESFENVNNNKNNDKHTFQNQLTPEIINSPQNITALHNAGNPPPDYFINANQRPMEDFLVNNMVPFFSGTGTNQDMRGTGVAQANVKSSDFNLGNDYKTPNNTTLSTFVGCDDTYLHKREAPAFFSPLEQRDRNTVPGEDASAQRPLRDRYTTSLLTKNDEAPFERQLVGPGINVDSNLPNDGQGYNSGLSTQIKPTNVNAYRLTQLPGRISGTKYQASNLPEALPGTGPSFESLKHNNNNMINSEKLIHEDSMYGIPTKKDQLLIDLERRPPAATPAITQAPMHYSNYIFPSGTNRRTVTNVSFGQSVEIK